MPLDFGNATPLSPASGERGFADHRQNRVGRLRIAWPWSAATVGVSSISPLPSLAQEIPPMMRTLAAVLAVLLGLGPSFAADGKKPTLQWHGQSFFELTTSQGTRIVF